MIFNFLLTVHLQGKKSLRGFYLFPAAFLICVSGLTSEQVPNFAITRIDEKRVVFYEALEDLKENDILVINFTGSSCKPCKIEVPKMLQFKKEINLTGRKGKLHLWIVFVGDDREKASATAKILGIGNDIPLFYDILEASYDRFHFTGVPVSLAFDRKGEIFVREDGYSEEKFIRFTEKISERLK